MNNKYLSDRILKLELDRCESCLGSPCANACPAACSPKEFILAARGMAPSDFLRAGEMILKQVPLGGVCGAVCTEKNCVNACSMNMAGRPVDIPGVQAAIMRRAYQNGAGQHFAKAAPNGKRVAVAGAGPAGLSAAAALAQAGCAVTVFDDAELPGGMCRLIPEARLPTDVLAADAGFIRGLGVEFLQGRAVEKPLALLDEYDGVVAATGRWRPNRWGAVGEANAVPALEYLAQPCKAGGPVAVVGGGGVAADCVRKALDEGAPHVDLFTLETLAELPLSDEERAFLFTPGIELHLRHAVTAVNERADGRFDLAVRHVALPQGEGFRPAAMRPVDGSDYKLSGYALVVNAVGSTCAPVAETGNLVCAGEVSTGPSGVVESVASGKAAAARLLVALGVPCKAGGPVEGLADETPERLPLMGWNAAPADLSTTVFGLPVEAPFVLAASPVADDYARVRDAYRQGWSGAVLKTAFDGIPVRTPAAYMHCAAKQSYANCDSVSARPLADVCRDVERLREEFPRHLTMASTGTEMSADDEQNKANWQRSTRMLEDAGAMAVEYSLSCPGTDGTDEPAVNQNVPRTLQVAKWILEAGDPNVPKLFKLTASVPSVAPFVEALRGLGAQYPQAKFGLTIGDTLPNLIFQNRGKARWEDGVVMGMGGARIWPINAFAIAGALGRGVPVNASGGVFSYRDAANYLAMGVDFVQICSMVMRYGYGVIDELKSGVAHLMAARGIKTMSELRGVAGPDVVLPFGSITEEKEIPKLEKALCAKCGNCQTCHAQAVHADGEGYPVFDETACIGCSFCTQICFTGALRMRAREK